MDPRQVEEMEQEVLSLFYTLNDPSPHVQMEVQGAMTTFIVDTGAFDSCVTRKHVKAWGLEDQIEHENSADVLFIDIRVKGRVR